MDHDTNAPDIKAPDIKAPDIKAHDTKAHDAKANAMAAMPEFYMRNLQRTSAKMLRAQERMMQGMMQAAQLQMKATEDFWGRRTGSKPAETSAQGAAMVKHESETMMGVMHEITQTMQRSFTEAMQMMMENVEQTADDARTTTRVTAQTMQQTAQANMSKVQDGMNKMNKTPDAPFRGPVGSGTAF